MALEGTLQDMKLVDLFEIFNISNKSGILRLFTPDKESAVYVALGRLIDAIVYDTNTQKAVITGDDAILQILQWDAAEFIFAHDPSTIRHPVTIFHEIDQLIWLSAELPAPALPVARLPHMAMPISLDLAFSYHFDTTGYTGERQVRHSALFTANTTRVHSLPLVSQMYRLDLVPADEVQYAAPAASARSTLPALHERVAGEACTAAQVPQAPLPPRKVVPSAGRNLLAAVLRRVRAL